MSNKRILLVVLGALGALTCDTGPPTLAQVVNPGGGGSSTATTGLTPTPSYQTLSASDTSNHSVAVPTGADDVISNLDSNVAYCNFGAASTTSAFPIPAGATFGFHNGGAFSTVQCQSPTSSLKITISGGSGLFTGGGGGGGGSSSVPTGSAGSPNSAVLSVQGISGMTAVSSEAAGSDISGFTWPTTICGTAPSPITMRSLLECNAMLSNNLIVQVASAPPTGGGFSAVGVTQYAGGTLSLMQGLGYITGLTVGSGLYPIVTNFATNTPPGGANFNTGQQAVGTTAVAIIAARAGLSGTGRITASLSNPSTAPCTLYIGPPGVTTSTGRGLEPGVSATYPTQSEIDGLYSSGCATTTVTYTETY